ncbi:hypothetical protein [Acholeplasma granularum]|uniref:hypothetical protein n=1 Tax=Acholeplasma granularum TaxID=264635 RepID=UPI00046EF2F8|nr:hypothetical protein [Acholeplasma granularum]
MKDDLNKLVTPTLDSHHVSLEAFNDVKVYDKPFEETKPTPPPQCFLGAWYHKVFSSKDQWLGIEGTIRLGEFIPDPKRFGHDNRTHWQRYLDSPSIYMGGHALSESDAGLGLMSGYETLDTSTPINYGTKKVSYRPFYRYIYSEAIDKNGNVQRNNVNSWNVSDPTRFEYYYFPGDLIKMSVYSPLPNYLQLKIEVLETTTIEKYKNQRALYKLKNNQPSTYYSPLFFSEGHGLSNAEFKRVNSIDQYGNEGSNVKLTDAKVTKATWESVYLYRKIEDEIVKVPFNKERQSVMTCPNVESFTITQNEEQIKKGGESIEIHPTSY